MDTGEGYSLQQAQELELYILDANNMEPRINMEGSCISSLSLKK